jgi:hypothetical protein
LAHLKPAAIKTVIPAKAGIQFSSTAGWIPAFAGMTVKGPLVGAWNHSNQS